MKNYRIEFLFPNRPNKFQAESLQNFPKLAEKYYKIVAGVSDILIKHSLYKIWHFYEPHVEITWYDDLGYNLGRMDEIYTEIEMYLRDNGIYDYIRKGPEQGEFADWFCTSDKEREFGGLRHALCHRFVDLYNEYKDAVDNGKGLRKQVERTIHTLCNPLGIDYKTEAKLCFSRGLICLLFCFFPFERAVWIYRNVFRQTY